MDLITTEGMGKKELALVKAGATREASYKTMVDGLSANTITIDKYGDEHEYPDHNVRLKSAELISKLNGDLKTETTIDNRSVTINTDGVSVEIIKGMMDMVKDVKNQLEALRVNGRQTGDIIDVTGL